ncbi:MAG: MotA/TolQ/ExbB proton channel family protein, partial [Deltaproteobacteria bacterium]
MSPMEFLNLVRSGGVAMVVIVLCGLLALGVAVERIVALWSVVSSARDLGDAVARHLFRGEVAEGRAACERSRAPAADIFLAGFARLGRASLEQVEAAVERERQAVGLRLRSHLWALGTVGAVAPFVGLFGTIVGIMRAFHQIYATGQGGFSVVAEGISEALVTTAGGIVAAVVAVVLYNYFQSRVQRTLVELKLVSDEFLEVLKEQKPSLPQAI